MLNQKNKKKILSVFKYFIMITFMVLIFSATSTIAYACNCGGRPGPCDPSLNCSNTPCTISCHGHKWDGHHEEKINSRTITRTCTRDGYSQDQYYKYDYCTIGTCGSNGYKKNEDRPWGSPYNYQSHTGCNFTSWYDNGSNSKHYKHCQNGHHDEGVDGSKYNSAYHSLGSKHQGSNGGDWKWHKDCTVYNCYRRDVDWGWNIGYVTFHYGNGQGSTGKSAAANSTITSPGSFTAAGKTLVGWNTRSSSPTEYHVQQVPGASLIAGKYNWSTGTAKAVTELVPSAKNNETGYDNAAGVWEYNYIRVHYRSGYGDGLSNDTYTDYVDYAQSLTSRKITQFSRTGYDIITKGWFIGKTNENSYTHHINKSADAVCGDNAQYAFNKNYSAQQWSPNVVNNHITDIYLYPHWRAHVLTVKYNINGGNGSVPSAVWYYDDGASGTTQKTYYVSNSVPTRAGYVFMGWGNSNKWCPERYASQSANDGSGYKIAYDGTQAKREAKTAQDWASYFGVRSTFDKQDTSITFYAQWERKRHSRSIGKPKGFIFLSFFIINIVPTIYF